MLVFDVQWWILLKNSSWDTVGKKVLVELYKIVPLALADHFFTGQGLGKQESGIAKPIKVAIKRDNIGVSLPILPSYNLTH